MDIEGVIMFLAVFGYPVIIGFVTFMVGNSIKKEYNDIKLNAALYAAIALVLGFLPIAPIPIINCIFSVANPLTYFISAIPLAICIVKKDSYKKNKKGGTE